MSHAFLFFFLKKSYTRARANVRVSGSGVREWDECGGRRSGAFSRSDRESESDSAGPSATVTEVRNMVVLESKSERSRRLPTQRIGQSQSSFHCPFRDGTHNHNKYTKENITV